MNAASKNTYISKRMMSVYKEEREKKQQSSLAQDNKALPSKAFTEEEEKFDQPKPVPKI